MLISQRHLSALLEWWVLSPRGGSCWIWKTRRWWCHRRWCCRDPTSSPPLARSGRAFAQTSPPGLLSIESFWKRCWTLHLHWSWYQAQQAAIIGIFSKRTTDQYNLTHWCQEPLESRRGISWSRCSLDSSSPKCCPPRLPRCPPPSSGSQQTSPWSKK